MKNIRMESMVVKSTPIKSIRVKKVYERKKVNK